MNIDPVAIFATVFSLVFSVTGAILVSMSRVPKQTIDQQAKLIEAQTARLDLQDAQNIENIKAIAELQGQIRVYKELPLQEMATAMQHISEVNQGIADSNKEILKTLRDSAHLLSVKDANTAAA